MGALMGWRAMRAGGPELPGAAACPSAGAKEVKPRSEHLRGAGQSHGLLGRSVSRGRTKSPRVDGTSANSALTMITLTEPTSPVAILRQNFVMAV